MTLLYLIRHGETLLNNTGVLQGITDYPLNEAGIKQSKNLVLKMKDINLDHILSSTLKRSYMTAAYLADSKNLEIEKLKSLGEIDFGAWENMHYKEIERLYPRKWRSWCVDSLNSSPLYGESFDDFFDRVTDALISILDLYKEKTVAIVSHDGVMRIMASFLLKMDKQGFWNFYFEHGKYSLFEVIDDICMIRRINV